MNTLYPGENSIHKNNDADGKLQKVSGNCWRVNALARTLQLFTDRPNNHSRSRELRAFLYDIADL
jgi:hypothetical protein